MSLLPMKLIECEQIKRLLESKETLHYNKLEKIETDGKDQKDEKKIITWSLHVWAKSNQD